MTYLIYGAVIFCVLFLVEGLYYLAVDLSGARKHRQINRRLRLQAQTGSSETTLLKLKRDSAGDRGAWLRSLPLLGELDRFLGQAGLTIPLLRFLIMQAAISAILLLTALTILRLAVAPALLLALFGGVLLPMAVVALLRGRRIKQFDDQLVNAIDMVVRSLRAGHPVSAAVGLVAREMADPVGSEFGIVFDEMTYGLDLRDALKNLSQRMPVEDLRFLVVAISLQHGIGGNLAEILANLSRVIRDRKNMYGKIRALSAEGKFSALVLSLLPFGVGGMIMLTSPNYFTAVQDDPMFLKMLGYGLAGIVLGIIVMHRIVNFRV